MSNVTVKKACAKPMVFDKAINYSQEQNPEKNLLIERLVLI